MLRHRGGLLQTVDLGIDFLQRFAVRGPKILPAGEGGYLPQRAFVDRHLHAPNYLPAVMRPHGNRGRAAAAGADGVNLDSQRFGNLGRFQRLRQARVVAAVRQQNHHLARRRVLTQSFHT